jgi:MFS transporter, DHA1 family, multidrug resistance protein
VWTGLTIIFPILPRFIERFDGGITELAYAVSAFALATFLFSPIIGNMADRIGKKKVIIVGLFFYGVSNILFLFATSIYHIIIIRFIEGIAVSGITPAAIAIVSDIVGKNERGRNIAFVTAGISFGAIVGPIFGAVLYMLFSFYGPFLVSAALGFVAAFFAIKIIPDTHAISDELPTESIKLKFFKKYLSKDYLTLIYSKIPKPLLIFGILVFIQFTNAFSWMLIEVPFVFYFYNDLNYTELQFGFFVAVYGIFVFAGEVFFGGLSDKYGRRPIIIIGGLVHGLFYYVLMSVTEFYLLLISAVIAGIALGLVVPSLNALISDVSDPKHRAFVLGLVTSFGSLAHIIGPIVGSWYVEEQIGSIFNLMFFSGTLVLFGAILSYFLVFNRSPKLENPSHLLKGKIVS